ncbi:MAG: hypothetical protein COS41_02995, partial [Elusimicrobia bacterium CG03_land_8_20_14_0_80_50_18]
KNEGIAYIMYSKEQLEKALTLTGKKLEIKAAAGWALKHDSSEGFRSVLKDMLRELGYESSSEEI